MEYLTGKKGTPHFTSEQFRTILAAIGGTGSYIAKLHEELEPELAVNNTIKIRSGLLMHHGGIFLINQGTYDEVNYQNGTQGMKRIDLVVARYTKNAETGIEEGEWVVIQGTPDAQNPTAPAYIAGDMQNGDLIDDCPLLEVHFNGINVTEIKKLVAVTPNIDGLEKEITELNGKFLHEMHQFKNISFEAGSLATRAIQHEVDIEKNGYRIMSVYINYILQSSSIIPICFTANSKLYLNIHRATQNSVQDNQVYVTVVYEKV